MRQRSATARTNVARGKTGWAVHDRATPNPGNPVEAGSEVVQWRESYREGNRAELKQSALSFASRSLMYEDS